MLELNRREINECHLECGALLAGSFIQAGLVDEMLYYMAPCLMGSEARPLVNLPIANMSEKRSMRISSSAQVGDDLRLTLIFDK